MATEHIQPTSATTALMSDSEHPARLSRYDVDAFDGWQSAADDLFLLTCDLLTLWQMK